MTIYLLHSLLKEVEIYGMITLFAYPEDRKEHCETLDFWGSLKATTFAAKYVSVRSKLTIFKKKVDLLDSDFFSWIKKFPLYCIDSTIFVEAWIVAQDENERIKLIRNYKKEAYRDNSKKLNPIFQFIFDLFSSAFNEGSITCVFKSDFNMLTANNKRKAKFQFVEDPKQLGTFLINGREPNRNAYTLTISQKTNKNIIKTQYNEIAQAQRIYEEGNIPDLYLKESDDFVDEDQN